MKINILGTDYEYIETTHKEDPALFDKAGYCDAYAKTISVEADLVDNQPDSIKNIESFKSEVKRHEIIHAYFHESGLKGYSGDELLIDWIAHVFPKMLDTFNQIGALQEKEEQ